MLNVISNPKKFVSKNEETGEETTIYRQRALVGLRFAEGERDYQYLVTSMDLNDAEKLTDWEFEKFTDGGIPIFQSPAYRQLELGVVA